MKKITDECVCCGLPCLGESCPYRRVVRYYCDKCGREEKLYYYDDMELCADCILEDIPEDEYEDFELSDLEVVEESDW